MRAAHSTDTGAHATSTAIQISTAANRRGEGGEGEISRGYRPTTPSSIGADAREWGPARRPGPVALGRTLRYGLIWVTRVDQFAAEPRVSPHSGSLLYCANVHVWAMYSFAIQMLFPDAWAAG